MENVIILSHQQIINKTKRIAYQILESSHKEKEIVVAGITGNGYTFASNIVKHLKKICKINIVLCEVFINKKKPLESIKTSITANQYKNKQVILVDDVLNSGSTLIYGIKHFLEVPLKKFKTAVLINRNHKKYPVKADFKGISLSTSLQENIDVIFEENNYRAILN